MLEAKVYTPRSSFEHERHVPGFLRLPIELRTQIYEEVFADVHPRPLLIRRYRGHQWLYRRSKSTDHIPGVLCLNKQVYIEARDVLHKVCFASADQPVIIEHVQCLANTPPAMEPRDWNNICAYTSVRDIIPVLQSLPRIRLEVGGTAYYAQQAHTTALLRWIRAVLNERPSLASPSHVPLRSFDVIFGIPFATHGNFPLPTEKHGLIQATMGVKGVVEEPEVWFSWATQRPDNRVKVKVSAGERLFVPNVPLVGWEDEASAWEGVKKAWKAVKAGEDERAWQAWRAGIFDLNWGFSLSNRVRNLLGR